MKRILLLLSIFTLVCFINSCKHKTKEEQSIEFQNSLTEGDTLEVLRQGNKFMDLLKAKETNDALSMLYEYDKSKDEMKPIGEGTREQFTARFRMFPVDMYLLQSYSFILPTQNQLKYNMQFTMKTINGDDKCVTAIMFNPVKFDGKWYLTIPLHNDIKQDSIK